MSSHGSKEKGKGRAIPGGAASARDGSRLTSPETYGADEIVGNGASNAFDRITSSASSLFQSLLQPTPNEASALLQTSQATKAEASDTSGTGSSYFWAEASEPSRQRLPPSQALSAQEHSTGFRTSTITPSASLNDEFQNFSNEVPVFSSGQVPREMTTAQPFQEDILQLLSSPTLTEAIWDVEPPTSTKNLHGPQGLEAYRLNTQDFQVSEFLATDDIVEFLSREGTIYTEEVWGDMLGLLQEAHKEVQDSKGKEKRQNDNAVERLKMIRNQLRSKL